MKQDEAIEEIRSIRRQIAQQCDNDPHKLVEHYIQQQSQNPQRLRKTAKRSASRCE
jgi:hypothetical protein